jgi:hypothetical protein
MKQHRILISASVPICLLLAAAVGLAHAQGPEPPSSHAPQGALGTAASASLGTSFTYQGQLKLDGEPVNAECELAFRLYDHASDDSQVASPITETVVISDGLFTQPLDFGSGVFSGDARWLGIRVMCPGDAGFADLGRQALTAAPYAHYALSTGALHGLPVTPTVPTAGQVLEWDGAAWGPASDDTTTYTAGNQLDLVGTTFDVLEGTGSDLDADLLDGEDGAYYLDWANLTGVPTGLADGDNDTTYGAGTGLDLTGTEFSITTTFQLPQTCTNGQAVVWDGMAWACTTIADGDVTGVYAGSGLTGGGAGGEVTLTVAFSGTGIVDTAARSDHNHDGTYVPLGHTHTGDEITTAVPTATYALQAATAAIASDVEAGVITPIHLHGITDSGASGQVLASDGSGGFAWQTPTAATVQQLVQDFVVASGASISAGDVVAFINGQVRRSSEHWGLASVFNAAGTTHIAIASLSATDFVVAYRDEDNSDYGTAITGTVSGGTLSWGPALVFNTAGTTHIAVASLSATDFVVAYRDEGNSYYGTAVTGTVNGGGLSWGSESVFNAAITFNIAVSSLSTTDFVVAYTDWDNSGHGTAITGTVGGGTLTWGSESVFNAARTEHIAVSSLSTTDFVVVYEDYDNSSYGTAITGTVSGGALSWGPESVFNAAITYNIAASSLSATEFVVAYRDAGNSGYGTAITGTVGGGTLTWGSESVFNAAITQYIAVAGLSPTDFVVAYTDWDISGYGTAITGTVGGGTLSWGPESVFNAAATYDIAISSLSATDFVVAYMDWDNSHYGTAIVNHRGQLIGTASTAASGSETVTVIISGVSDVHSGLVPGQMYYLQEDGSLGLTPTQDRVGLAISETDLILDQMW